MLVTFARRSALRLRGGLSIGPAAASALTSTETVPALTTNVRADPPSITSRNAATKATSAGGLAAIALKTACTISLGLPLMSSPTSAFNRSATRKIPPRTGTASSSFSVDSATNCTTTSGQFAAVMSAPRLSAAFRPGACDIGRSQFTFAVSCFTSASLSPARTAGKLAAADCRRSYGCRDRAGSRFRDRALAVRLD